jgi:hypothetical protein
MHFASPTLRLSCPRRRASSNQRSRRAWHEERSVTAYWIPAYAGMTGEKRWMGTSLYPPYNPRHGRAWPGHPRHSGASRNPAARSAIKKWTRLGERLRPVLLRACRRELDTGFRRHEGLLLWPLIPTRKTSTKLPAPRPSKGALARRCGSGTRRGACGARTQRGSRAARGSARAHYEALPGAG